jgi:hypothetical protein
MSGSTGDGRTGRPAEGLRMTALRSGACQGFQNMSQSQYPGVEDTQAERSGLHNSVGHTV